MKSAMDDVREKMTEYERHARAIAKQMGQDPDALIGLGHPQFVHVPNGLYHIVDVGQLRPLWTAYLALARTALGVELKS